MNNDIYSIDFTRTLPPALRNDSEMKAIADGIAGELTKTAKEIKNNVIYARIDELPEAVLDVLAFDMHIDWYDYDYPIEVKRNLVKTSVMVHKKLGTKYAVRTALGALHPQSTVEEWFDYGGKPYRFRLILDISESRVEVDITKIIATIGMYKRLTAHLDGIIYNFKTHADLKSVSYGGINSRIKILAFRPTQVSVRGNMYTFNTLRRGDYVKIKPRIDCNEITAESTVRALAYLSHKEGIKVKAEVGHEINAVSATQTKLAVGKVNQALRIHPQGEQ